jgi:hypothetical protein
MELHNINYTLKFESTLNLAQFLFTFLPEFTDEADILIEKYKNSQTIVYPNYIIDWVNLNIMFLNYIGPNIQFPVTILPYNIEVLECMDFITTFINFLMLNKIPFTIIYN